MTGSDPRSSPPARPGIRLCLAAAVLLVGEPSEAQVPDSIDYALASLVSVDISNPGARSLGMAGTFIGLADDASAAYANPAGLRNLSEPEIFVEFRGYLDFGVGFGEDRLGGLSFLSYVHPRRGWVLAVYGHDLADSLITAGDVRLRLGIANFGLSGALRLRDDLSVGVGLSHYGFEVNSLVSPVDRLGDRNDSELGINLGVFWRMSERWALGGAFRQGPDFRFTTHAPGHPARPRSFHVDDRIGMGLAYKPRDSIRLAGDLDYAADRDVLRPSVGFEYLRLKRHVSWAIRVGYASPDLEDASLSITSLGLGFVFGNRVQLDAAVGSSDEVGEVGSVSLGLLF